MKKSNIELLNEYKKNISQLKLMNSIIESGMKDIEEKRSRLMNLGISNPDMSVDMFNVLSDAEKLSMGMNFTMSIDLAVKDQIHDMSTYYGFEY